MDFKKLAQTTQALHKPQISDSTKKALERLRSKKKPIDDSATNFSKFRKLPSYRALKRAIKDALEETETTEEAVGAALQQLTPDTPAEQTLAAVVETLGDTIDQLTDEDDDSDDI